MMPPMYDDLWTAAKGMYKIEPAVADGGEVVIYAPHVTEVSYVHGKLLDEVGYHCRDYFVVAVGTLQALSRRHPGALDPRAGPGDVRRVVRPGNAAHPGHARHRHPARAMRADQPRIPGPGHGQPRRVARARRLAGGPARGRDAVPGGAAAGVGGVDIDKSTPNSQAANIPSRSIAQANRRNVVPTSGGGGFAPGFDHSHWELGVGTWDLTP